MAERRSSGLLLIALLLLLLRDRRSAAIAQRWHERRSIAVELMMIDGYYYGERFVARMKRSSQHENGNSEEFLLASRELHPFLPNITWLPERLGLDGKPRRRIE